MVKQQFRETDLARKIVGVKFQPANYDDMRQSSHMEIWRNLYYEEGTKFEPAEGGPLDRKLGVSKEQFPCKTCGKTLKTCVGHFGYVDLHFPVFHVGYFRLTIQVLQCICKKCAKVLLSAEKKQTFCNQVSRTDLTYLQRKNVYKKIIAACKKNTKCQECGYKNGVVKKAVGAPMKIVHVSGLETSVDEFRLAMETNNELEGILGRCKQELLSPLDVYNLFQHLQDCDVPILLGRNGAGHPRDLLVKRIPVPPVCIRPSVISDTKSTEDDLTSRIIDILSLNMAVLKSSTEGASLSKIVELWDTLQIQCALYINSELSGIPSNMQARKFKRSFAQRLKGKQGRFRGNLSGKRVDFSGRTVISPDPNLRIDQVGVPEQVAKILTYPERVTAANIEDLRKLVANGAYNHPGASYIQSRGDKTERGKVFLGVLNGEKREHKAQCLRLGDTVERHLRDGDIVLFNRQPSLHKISIMSHRAKVFSGRTFRFNECVCTPYNADFDGDEMNLHLPQTEEARTEAALLMGVASNLVTPRNGEPLVAAIQDFITAGYLLTSKDRFFDRKQVCQLIASIIGGPDMTMRIDIPPPVIVKPKRLWTGKQVFSLIIRPNKNSPVKLNMRAKAKVYDKNEDLSPKDTFVVIRNGELMCGVMEKATLGSGSKNNMFYKLLREFGQQIAIDALWRLARLAPCFLSNHGFSIGIGDVTPGPGLLKAKQQLLDEGYAGCKDLINQFQNGQLRATAGQSEEETLEAHILNKLSNIREAAGTACHKELSPHNSPLIMAVCGSKGSNINISQMIASVGQQTISGKRAPNGFEQRSLPHFARLEKTPEAKGFVEDSFYSGLTPTEFFFHTMAGREGLVDTAVKTAETGYMQRRLVKCLEDLCAQYDDTIRTSVGEIVQFRYGDDGLDPACMEAKGKVLDLNYLLEHCKAVHNCKGLDDKLGEEDMETLIQSILEDKLKDCDKIFRDELGDFLKKKIHASNRYFEMEEGELRESLIETQCLSARVVREFLETSRLRWKGAITEPGTAVGAVGATSIGEPSTQMTLKTFHFAGVASMNITRGVPRIKEIINAVRAISTPVIVGPLEESGNEDTAKKVKARIEKTTLGDVAEYIEDVYLPTDSFVLIKVSLKRIMLLQLETSLGSIACSIASAKLGLPVKLEQIETVGKSYLLIRVQDTAKMSMYHGMQHLKQTLQKVVITGLPSVNRCIVEADEKTGKKFTLMVEGTDFLQVIATPGIDWRKSKFNNSLEVANVLGIEAARICIIEEILDTMAHHGIGLDQRHVMLLADLMTYRGEVLGITRHGLAKMKESVLLLASFERTIDHLFEASFFEQEDIVNGVSDSIIMGIPMTVGTGLFNLIQKTKTELPTKRVALFQNPEFHVPI